MTNITSALNNSDINDFSLEFREEIAQSNRIKDRDAPTAVVLRSCDDPSEAFAGPSTTWKILEVAKTHFISLNVIRNKQEISQILDDTERTLKRPIKILWMMGHGWRDLIQMGSNPLEPFTELDIESVNRETIDTYFFDACLTGQKLAPKLAQKTNKTVIAALEEITGAVNYLQNCPDHGLEWVSYNRRPQKTVIFEGANSRPPCKMEFLFQEMIKYIQVKADEGDPHAQYQLAIFYRPETNLPGIESSEKEEVKYYQLAALQGHREALFELGGSYHYGKGDLKESHELAGHYFQLAAEKKHPDAVYNMGLYHLHGLGNFEVSDELAGHYFQLAAELGVSDGFLEVSNDYFDKAIDSEESEKLQELGRKYLTLAAEKSNPKALCELGKCYCYRKKGYEQSLELAKWCFEYAAELDDLEALYELGRGYYGGLWDGGCSESSDQQALKYLTLAANLGHSEAKHLAEHCFK